MQQRLSPIVKTEKTENNEKGNSRLIELHSK